MTESILYRLEIVTILQADNSECMPQIMHSCVRYSDLCSYRFEVVVYRDGVQMPPSVIREYGKLVFRFVNGMTVGE